MTKKRRIAQSRKQRITGKTILELICILTSGNLVTRGAKKNNKPISVIPVSRRHDNRNNSIKRSGILFYRTDRGG